MIRQHDKKGRTIQLVLPISDFLLGSTFLVFACGIKGLILLVRGAIEGFSNISLGLLGTGWTLDYFAGSIMTSNIVARVGHVRASGALVAIVYVWRWHSQH